MYIDYSKKLTKKQKKLLKGGNAAVIRSLEDGKPIGACYTGAVPVYRNIADSGQPDNWVKVRAGVPFVKPSNHNL